MRTLALILLLSACVAAPTVAPAPAVQKIRSLPMPLNVNDAIPGDLNLRAVYYDGSCWGYELGGKDYPAIGIDGKQICGEDGSAFLEALPYPDDQALLDAPRLSLHAALDLSQSQSRTIRSFT